VDNLGFGAVTSNPESAILRQKSRQPDALRVSPSSLEFQLQLNNLGFDYINANDPK
jgi:hypothetical protein